MQHIQGISRQQLQVVSLEDTISQDNPVRFVDAFVHSINLEKIGFKARGNTIKRP
jgi:hypothetical protein